MRRAAAGRRARDIDADFAAGEVLGHGAVYRALDETVEGLRGGGMVGAVGKEVGFCLVSLNPIASWTGVP